MAVVQGVGPSSQTPAILNVVPRCCFSQAGPRHEPGSCRSQIVQKQKSWRLQRWIHLALKTDHS